MPLSQIVDNTEHPTLFTTFLFHSYSPEDGNLAWNNLVELSNDAGVPRCLSMTYCLSGIVNYSLGCIPEVYGILLINGVEFLSVTFLFQWPK